MEGGPLQRHDFMFHVYQDSSFTRDSEIYVIEGSGNGHLYPYGPCWGNVQVGAPSPGTLRDTQKKALETGHLYGSSVRGTWSVGFFTGENDRHLEGSGNGGSLSL
jgi:hypothetical protein